MRYVKGDITHNIVSLAVFLSKNMLPYGVSICMSTHNKACQNAIIMLSQSDRRRSIVTSAHMV